MGAPNLERDTRARGGDIGMVGCGARTATL